MLPVVKGDDATFRQILIYTYALILVSLAIFAVGAGWLYLLIAGVLGGYLLKKALVARRLKTVPAMRGLFGFSIVYLFGLFLALIADILILRAS
jgi:protoheme IX farnesyltransferase